MFIVGTSVGQWFKLLAKNKFKISWKYVPRAIAISFLTFVFSPLILVERVLFNRKIVQKKISKQPIFILGHWRTGTTFLHELLISDPQHAYITLTESVFPHYFLCFSSFFRWLLSLFLPKTRPQDNMRIGPDFPSEHDFAITNLCSMSPYSGAYFPTNQDYYNRYVTFENVSTKEKRKLKKTIRYLIKKLDIKKENKRLVLKSPVDTARVDLLVELFPNAKFVHIIRDPYRVFFSTKRMHEKLTSLLQLQEREEDLDEFVLSNFEQMYEKFYHDLSLIPKENIVEVRYENLVENPLKELERIYNSLSLPGFENAKPMFEQYLENVKDYQPSSYAISSDDEQMIYSRWHKVIDKWGYKTPSKSLIC
ncbi:MAG: sulfotransferase family protein [Candidatus Heimdallarchaeaceae archaeon]